MKAIKTLDTGRRGLEMECAPRFTKQDSTLRVVKKLKGKGKKEV